MAKAKKKAAKKPANKAASKKASSSDNSKVCAALSYVFVGIVWYFVDEQMKKNKFVNFHVKQGVALLIIWISGHILFGMLWFIGLPLMILWQIAMIVLVIIGMINSFQNKKTLLPVIGKIGERINF